MKQEQQPKTEEAKLATRRDARLISLPEGVQVYRDGKIRYYWYNQINDSSRRRLWSVMDQCLQLVSNPNIHIYDKRMCSSESSQTKCTSFSIKKPGELLNEHRKVFARYFTFWGG